MKEQEQEKRFLEWVKARDDDWWDEAYDGDESSRISIWDFRVMQEFFREEVNRAREEVVEEFRDEIDMLDRSMDERKTFKEQQIINETKGYLIALYDLRNILDELKQKYTNKGE